MYKKILIGVENLEDAQKALNSILEFYKTWNSKIVVFHSFKEYLVPLGIPSTGWIFGLPLTPYAVSRSENYEEGKKLLNDTKKIFEKAGIPIDTRLVEDIKPEDYAKNMVKKENFDLVIIGEKKYHSRIDTLLSRSIPKHIINDIDSDVLVLH